MRKTFFMIIGFLLSYSVSVADNYNHSELLGFWGDAFPVSTAENGYYFLEDKIYLYVTFHKEDIQHQYYGSSGSWEIGDSGDILIHKEREYYWKAPLISDNGIYQIPMDEDALICKKVFSWSCQIGNINKYIEYDGINPPKIFFKNDSCSKILMYWKTKVIVKKQVMQDMIEKRLQMPCLSER